VSVIGRVKRRLNLAAEDTKQALLKSSETKNGEKNLKEVNV
jgi:hypothetical protein